MKKPRQTQSAGFFVSRAGQQPWGVQPGSLLLVAHRVLQACCRGRLQQRGAKRPGLGVARGRAGTFHACGGVRWPRGLQASGMVASISMRTLSRHKTPLLVQAAGRCPGWWSAPPSCQSGCTGMGKCAPVDLGVVTGQSSTVTLSMYFLGQSHAARLEQRKAEGRVHERLHVDGQQHNRGTRSGRCPACPATGGEQGHHDEREFKEVQEERQEEHHDVHDDQEAQLAAGQAGQQVFHPQWPSTPWKVRPKMVAPTRMNTTKHDSLGGGD